MSETPLEISALCLEHESLIADYVSSFAAAGESAIHGYLGKPDWDHALAVEKFDAWSRGEDLEGWVSNTTRFLFEDGRIVGNYNFRHELTDALTLYGGNCGYSVRPSERRKGHATMLLRHAKGFGRTLGLDRMLVVCSVENVGSSRVITNNGGVLENVVLEEASAEHLARYWITL